MATEILNMLSDLANDQGKLAAFRANPDTIMNHYGLSAEQKNVITKSPTSVEDYCAHNLLVFS